MNVLLILGRWPRPRFSSAGRFYARADRPLARGGSQDPDPAVTYSRRPRLSSRRSPTSSSPTTFRPSPAPARSWARPWPSFTGSSRPGSGSSSAGSSSARSTISRRSSSACARAGSRWPRSPARLSATRGLQPLHRLHHRHDRPRHLLVPERDLDLPDLALALGQDRRQGRGDVPQDRRQGRVAMGRIGGIASMSVDRHHALFAVSRLADLQEGAQNALCLPHRLRHLRRLGPPRHRLSRSP